MKTRNLTMLATTFTLAAALVGCGSSTTQTATTNNTAALSNSNSSSTTATTAAASPAPKAGAATPTEGAHQLFDAMKSKDPAAIKATFSSKSLSMMEDGAKHQNKSLDDILLKMSASVPMPASFNARNEKIEGDKATVEVMDDKGRYSPVKLVKEDGVWKADLSGDK